MAAESVVRRKPLSTEEIKAANETTVLVVDDSATAQKFVGGLIRRMPGFRALTASNGREALEVLEQVEGGIAAVLTDLYMPEMDGLEFIERLRDDYPTVPAIVMTALGSEAVAVRALQSGAAGYVAKSSLLSDLESTLEHVLTAARIDRRRQSLLESMSELECRFVLENDAALVPLLVAHLQEHLVRMRLTDQNGRIRIGVALEEALLNGMHHGNLELSSELRRDGGDAYRRLGEERRHQFPYVDRRLHVHVRMDTSAAVFVIRDEGPGFDVSRVPDPLDPENFLKPSGRGLLLIQAFMDEVKHNDSGNQITLVRRQPSALLVE
jgi:CheY-like chemotaxis protein